MKGKNILPMVENLCYEKLAEVDLYSNEDLKQINTEEQDFSPVAP